MLFLNKKSIIIFSFFILILLLFLITCFLINSKTVETIALPVTNKVVIIDAGHGYPDDGAISSSGVTENKINLSIAKKLKKLFEDTGTKVVLTRSDENGIYELDAKTLRDKKRSDLKKRVEIGNSSNADVFISIHLNKIPQSQYYGWQTFYKNKDDQSKLLAENIQNSISSVIERDNKRVALAISNKYIVDNVNIPICIVECGFLSNFEEEKLLQDDAYQNKLAVGIFLGVVNYFNAGENTE